MGGEGEKKEKKGALFPVISSVSWGDFLENVPSGRDPLFRPPLRSSSSLSSSNEQTFIASATADATATLVHVDNAYDDIGKTCNNEGTGAVCMGAFFKIAILCTLSLVHAHPLCNPPPLSASE